MLMDLSMVEQRYRAVLEVLETGSTITDVAMRYGINRRTLHRWLLRYASGGLAGLSDRSCKPDRCPHQTDASVEAQIVLMRRNHPGWGPRTIENRLRRTNDVVPSRSSIYRCLVRHGLIDPKTRRRHRDDYKRWERSRAMELWQMDVMGSVYLTDGTPLSVVTGIDDHSRFCVAAKLVERATARPVCDALLEALNAHGIPESILTDNGKVFTGKRAPKPAIVQFDRICHNNAIKHILTAPFSPTTTGKIERLHKTMRKEFFADRAFDSIQQAQQLLDGWVTDYNNQREHQAIGDVPPARRFELAKPVSFEVVNGDANPPEPEPKRNLVGRRVDQAGRISILKHRYHVGRYLTGQTVQIESENGLLTITHNDTIIATHARRHLAEDDTKMDRRAKTRTPSRPTKGNEVKRTVDPRGSISFAGTSYRAGNPYIGQTAGVRLVGDTIQITINGKLTRTHQARHDKTKEHGALAQPNGKPRKNHVA